MFYFLAYVFAVFVKFKELRDENGEGKVPEGTRQPPGAGPSLAAPGHCLVSSEPLSDPFSYCDFPFV